MKTHRILGILWAIYCGYCCFYFLRALLSFHTAAAAGHWDAWGVLAVLFLLELAGIVASIFLFRGARWPRWIVGLIAVQTVLSGITFIIATKSLHAASVASSLFALASLTLLF